MVTYDTARRLKEAGLVWVPHKGDRFIVPDRGLDEQVFAVNDMAVIVEMLKGSPAVSFHGTPEWALDYVWVGEALWLPDEGQLRQLVQERLAAGEITVFDLLYADGVYTCRFEWAGQSLACASPDAAEAYADALLRLLDHPAAT